MAGINKNIPTLIDKFSTACLLMAFIETKTKEMLNQQTQANPNLSDGAEISPQTSADRIVLLATSYTMGSDGMTRKLKPAKPTLKEMYKLSLRMLFQASSTLGIGSYANPNSVEKQIIEFLKKNEISEKGRVVFKN